MDEENVVEQSDARKVGYWGKFLYDDLVQLSNRLHEARTHLTADEMGILAELDAANLIEQAKVMGQIDWQNAANNDHKRKVVGNPRSA